MEEKILYFFFLQRLISKIPEKKKRNQENVCPSRSIWYLGIHIFLKIEKTYKQKKILFKSKKCCFRFFFRSDELSPKTEKSAVLKKEGIVEKRP
jgi:hypothetical protein